MMTEIGYSHLITKLQLQVAPLPRTAHMSTSVNRRMEAENRTLFPRGVAIEDSPVGHLEFALRHEGVNLEVIDAVFEKLPPADLITRLKTNPSGEPIRRACFLWEWLRKEELHPEVAAKGGYADLFPEEQYVTSAHPVRHPKFRVRDNALGTSDFCPVVRRDAFPHGPSVAALMLEAASTLAAVTDPELYRRAISYLYLSETRGSYAIEHETPSADKQERFVQLLQRAGEPVTVDEEWLVQLQNTIVRDVYSQEASYRTKQNWLEDPSGQITFFPVPIDDLRRVMHGWENFANDRTRCTDVLVKAACVAFGFVYAHPFLDGNGRLHRFLIHHVLSHSGLLPSQTVIPVSAVILKNIPQYLAVLSAFSRPVTRLWDYRRGDIDPVILSAPSSRAYRFFNADRETAFMYNMIRQAVQEEIPRELAWLQSFDDAFSLLNDEFDLPQKDLSALIRMAQSNHGILSINRRKKYQHLPVAVLDRIEAVVKSAFGFVERE